MSGTVSDAQVLPFEVVCPHCRRAFVVTPDMLAASEVISPIPQADEDDDVDDPFRERVTQRVLDKEFEIPLLPHVAVRVIRLTGDAGTSMQDLARVILTDPGIAGRILQIANSPVYAAATEITTVNQALVRLGQNEVKNLMLAISLHTKIFKSVEYKALAEALWRRAVASALGARVVANALRMPKEEAFLSGLMSDVGSMVLIRMMEDAQKAIGPRYRPMEATVRGLLDRFGRDVSELAAKLWQLPDHVLNTLSELTRPADLDSLSPEAAAVSLARAMAAKNGIGPEADPALILENTRAAKQFRLGAEACEELERRFVQIHEQAKGVFE